MISCRSPYQVEKRAKNILDAKFPKDSPLLKWAEMVRDEATPELVRMLKDPDREVRVQCAYTLGNHGALDETVVPALINTLKGKDVAVQKGAVHALGKIENEAAIKGLIEAFRSKDKEVREEAINAFRWIGPEAIPILTPALDDNDPLVAISAKAAIKHSSGK